MMEKSNTVYIGIGSNEGNRIKKCTDAIQAFDQWEDAQLLSTSSLYETEPWGYEDQNPFINCVNKIETVKSARGVLDFIKVTENDLGKKKVFHWGPRAIDLDILFFNDEIIDTAVLKVPHPFLHLRNFVLEPLAEIEPHMIHPVLRKSIVHLLAEMYCYRDFPRSTNSNILIKDIFEVISNFSGIMYSNSHVSICFTGGI